MSLDPAVAAVRRAVRSALAGLPGPEEPSSAGVPPVLVACSGGADSLALLAATVFEARGSRRVVGVTVDHGLQEGSAGHTARVVQQMATLGADETVSVRVRVEPAGRGPEAAAREARYAVLEEVAGRTGAAAVLLGHTADDQAETVLLGLTRGSGGRSIAGMRRGFGPFLRPLLDLTRAQTEAACTAQGIGFWSDPHNDDDRFTRSRVRRHVLPVLEAELGPGVAATLARTADQVREDVEALDALADAARQEAAVAGEPGALDARVLAGQLPALRRRVLRLAALAAGSPGAELFRVHVLAMDALVTDWHGQREVQLPGHVSVRRSGGVLRFARGPVAG
ncbi:tRNA lysidine(34) synthetase TilS [Nocardioides mesophilus]|uniref:tRNA(Ile)-lysidine synthase n=1 Tax=Nocardioides mesophilus TaxID=433659 RepID=A0A7G9R6H5_9ACTN|nr:tRNA lysidine(34) synthetase TilS [Nocardioides mesophilus]QNN51200.1 tRNA lysidine(34) synthetase TilS [Nocardioides mesophilus]